MSDAPRPTVKQLRAEIERLGITEQLAGMSIDDLIRKAREMDDPSAFLRKFIINLGPVNEEITPLSKLDNSPPQPAEAAAIAAEPPPEESAVERFENEGSPAVAEELPAAPAFLMATIDVPIGELPIDQVAQGKIFISRHLEVRLSREQSVVLRGILAGLTAKGEKLRDGKPVRKAPDAVRWLLERFSLE